MDRPGTSSGRPTTAGGFGDGYSFAAPQTAYDQDYYDPYNDQNYPPDSRGPFSHDAFDDLEEEEEESEDEDVFAYLPPSTAEQALEAQTDPTLASSHQYSTDPPMYYQPPNPFPSPIHASDHPILPVNHSPPLPPPSAILLSHDPQAYASQVPFSAPSAITNSRLHHRLAATPPQAASPPSTTSGFSAHLENGTDAYRMRSMTAEAIGSGNVQPVSVQHSDPASRGSVNISRSGVSSREVHVTLPSRDGEPAEGHCEVDDDGDKNQRLQPQKRGSHGTTSSGVMSVLEDDDTHSKDIAPGAESYIPQAAAQYYGQYEEGEDSPYPEVRASVSNIDDPTMPVTTFRMWFIGLWLCVLGSSLNMFFNFRYPAPYIAPIVILLIAYPCGKFLAFTLPMRSFVISLPMWIGRKYPIEYEFNLNPGPFNIKEHVLIFIMANVSLYPAYAMNTIVVADKYYDIRPGIGFDFLLVLATQLTGFGLAGLCRRFLVWPASMVWPQNLVACTLLNTLHAEDDEGAEGITRYRFFVYAACASFVWYFLPGYLFQALSVFSWICWFSPNNVVVNQLFGVSSGLGMGILTFDWAQISWIGSPLMVPWWAEVHIFLGFVIFYWIMTPIMYYTNVWHFAHLPIFATEPFDRFANYYNVSLVMTAKGHTFNETAYDSYSPLYLPATYAVTYLIAFAMSTCVLVHTGLYHGRTLLNGLKRIQVEEDDIHLKLMKVYPEVPDWWYLVCFLVFFVMGILGCVLYQPGFPAWALLIAVSLPVIYILPLSFIYAVTGQSVGINLLAEIIPGSIFPGQPFVNMIFKSYTVQTLIVSINFVQDLKLGHYLKISPRATFLAQAAATVISSFTQVGVQRFLFANVHDICTPGQKSHLTCPHNTVFFTASAVWGLIGPTRQFGKGALYKPELYALLAGAILPIPFWLWQRKYPRTRLKYVSMPVLLNGPSFLPPATGINYSSWFVVGFFFQYLIRRRNFRWWSKFNYILSAALDSGTLVSVIFIFLVLQFPKAGSISVDWWGNNVFLNTADAMQVPYRTTDPIKGF